MPIDYKRYPSNWKDLRKQVLERAKNRCEHCGVKNYKIGYRDKQGNFHKLRKCIEDEVFVLDNDIKVIKIILTIAHLDHDETNHNVKIERLAALCQRCHLLYDVNEKKKRNKDKKAIGRFLWMSN